MPKEPCVPKELAEHLDRAFPSKCPDIKDSERLIWMNAGRRAVVEYVLDLLRRQEAGVSLDVPIAYMPERL